MTTPTNTIDSQRPRTAQARRGRFVFILGSVLVSVSALEGCDRTPAVTATGPTHTVRGKVLKLPVAGDPSSSFSVFHETIADWLRPDGTKGMNAMVMPFPLDSGAKLDGIAVGDVVELVVRQQPGNSVPYLAVSVRKLPPETTLTLPEPK